MNFLILTHQYPKKSNLYRSGFVHQRVKEYQLKGFNTEVWVIDNSKDTVEKYIFDNVNVYEGSINEFKNFIYQKEIDRILVHFLLQETMQALESLNKTIPIIVWVHLFEASSWYRRLFEFNSLSFLKYIRFNTKQLKAYRKFNESTTLNITYVFVSQWIKNVAENDIKTKFSKSHVIHNFVNTTLFNYDKKEPSQRKKILSIRTFQSKKYANDISAEAIKILSQKPEFNDLEFSLYGRGKYFKGIERELSKYPNVKMYDTFLTHEEMYNLYKEHGIFLCPTRQDSQGVSMGEAMSCGLIPVTTNNSAIPEFVNHGETGFLSNNPEEIAESILHLYHNEKEYLKVSRQASRAVDDQCGLAATIDREIEVIQNA